MDFGLRIQDEKKYNIICIVKIDTIFEKFGSESNLQQENERLRKKIQDLKLPHSSRLIYMKTLNILLLGAPNSGRSTFIDSIGKTLNGEGFNASKMGIDSEDFGTIKTQAFNILNTDNSIAAFKLINCPALSLKTQEHIANVMEDFLDGESVEINLKDIDLIKKPTFERKKSKSSIKHANKIHGVIYFIEKAFFDKQEEIESHFSLLSMIAAKKIPLFIVQSKCDQLPEFSSGTYEFRQIYEVFENYRDQIKSLMKNRFDQIYPVIDPLIQKSNPYVKYSLLYCFEQILTNVKESFFEDIKIVRVISLNDLKDWGFIEIDSSQIPLSDFRDIILTKHENFPDFHFTKREKGFKRLDNKNKEPHYFLESVLYKADPEQIPIVEVILLDRPIPRGFEKKARPPRFEELGVEYRKDNQEWTNLCLLPNLDTNNLTLKMVSNLLKEHFPSFSNVNIFLPDGQIISGDKDYVLDGFYDTVNKRAKRKIRVDFTMKPVEFELRNFENDHLIYHLSLEEDMKASDFRKFLDKKDLIGSQFIFILHKEEKDYPITIFFEEYYDIKGLICNEEITRKTNWIYIKYVK